MSASSDTVGNDQAAGTGGNTGIKASDGRPLAAGTPGGPTQAEHLGPPDTAPETGGPAFSMGGHGAGGGPPGASVWGEHDLGPAENVEQGSAEPDRGEGRPAPGGRP